jgi:hypothetical protein
MAALYAAAGVAYMGRGLMDFGDPAFSDATTPFDYAAVAGTTVAMILLAAAIALLTARGDVTGAAGKLAWVVVAGLALSGTANLLEDAFGVGPVGMFFGVGGFMTVVGLLATGLAGLLDRRNPRTVATVILAMGLASFLPVTLSWLIIGVLCEALAAWSWGVRRSIQR